ncbi:MAG: AtpZ/AtpI family protein [Planctomycetes bacterium]|nr:AtpZ/AtpI family protein [Planctomycetota bacterium]
MTHKKQHGEHEEQPPEKPHDPYQAMIDAAPRIPEVLRHPPELPADVQEIVEPSPASTSSLMEAGKAWGVALDFVFTIIGGLVIGWLLDRWMGFRPWGTLGGLAGGFVFAFIRIVRHTQRVEAREKAAKEAAQRGRSGER